MTLLFWCAVGAIIYVYAGYPLLLWLVSRLGGRRPVALDSIEPAVTLFVSAYNEEEVIGAKIENCLALDYPPGRLEIMVISDCSSDRTDQIAAQYAARGVKLLRMPARGGKTAGLNAGVREARGEILVFTDANAMFDARAVRMLVRNFADPQVGAVTGESRYQPPGDGRAAHSEGLYWHYELWIKRLESATGSLVGGDGAIYAIRRRLYRDLAPSDLSDFVNPLQIVSAGYRNVYETEAFSSEHAGDSFAKEYRRKVRIVNRAWRGMMSMARVLNPLRYGWFAVKAISHKLLRWLVPLFMLAALLANLYLLGRGGIYTLAFAAQVTFYLLALIGWLQVRGATPPGRLVAIPYYFVLVNWASLRGILDSLRGETYTTWTTVREKGAS